MKKYAEDLARELDLGQTKEDYFDYIIDSLRNGNSTQMRRLFNAMKKFDKKTFLIDHLEPTIGIHKSVLNFCIDELTQ